MTTTTGSSLEHTIGAEGLLAVRLRDGAVRLRGVDGPSIRVRDAGDHDLEEMFTIDTADGSLALSSNRALDLLSGRRDRRPSPDLDIEVPRGATIVIEAASGDIDADGLVGDQRYRTASGGLTMRAVSGRIAVEAVSGDVDILATGVTDVTARTVSGDVAVRAATLPALRATTTSGDLKIAGRLAGPGPYAIDTVSGDALLAPVGDVRIEMTTLTGDLRSDLDSRSESGRGRRSLVVGRGGPLVTFRSLSGHLHVVRPTVVGAPLATEPEPTTAAPSSREALAPGTQRAGMSPAITAAYDDARLRILRSLERGEIDVAEAARRLEALDGGEPTAPTGDASDA